MKVTHDNLICLGGMLSYSKLDEGLCAGFSGMWVQAVLANDEVTFFKRLVLLEQYINQFHLLVFKINKAQEKKGKNLTQEDIELLDILAFFDGIALYLTPHDYKNYFSGDECITQDNISSIFSVTKPKSLQQNQLTVLFDKYYTFTPSTLICYLNDLAEILCQSPCDLPIRFESHHHVVCLKYDRVKACWLYLDTNDFEKYPDSNYARELNTNELVSSIFASFNTQNYAVLNTMIFATEIDDEMQNRLDQFNKKYCLTVELANGCDDEGFNILWLACRNGHLDTVRELLKPNYKLELNPMSQGASPFYVACEFDHVKIVQTLLDHFGTTQVNQLFEGVTPFMIACKNGHLQTVSHLLINLEDKEINQTFYGATPFYVACEFGHLEIVRELLKYPEKVDFRHGNNGLTPFFIACQNGHSEIVQELLQHSNSLDVNKKYKGKTPFYVACEQGHFKIVQELLKNQDKIDIREESNGRTPFFIACQNGYLEIVQELLKYLNNNDMNKQFKAKTPFFAACFMGHTEIAKLLSPYFIENIDWLLYGVCLSQETIGKTDLFQEIIKKNIRLDLKDNDGRTALDIAFMKKNESAIKAVLQKAQEMNLTPYSIMSMDTYLKAMHWAKDNSEIAIYDYLYQIFQYLKNVPIPPIGSAGGYPVFFSKPLKTGGNNSIENANHTYSNESFAPARLK